MKRLISTWAARWFSGTATLADPHPLHVYHGRGKFVVLSVIVLFGFLACRLYAIQIARHDMYTAVKKSQGVAHENIEIARGTITDSRGTVLAVSRPVSSIYAQPATMADKKSAAQRLAAVLSMSPGAVLEKLSRSHRDALGVERPVKFSWLKRKVPEDMALAVRRLDLPGIGLRQEYRRLYPAGREGSHLLGITGIDENGSDGVEQVLEKYIHQNSRRATVDVDGRRRPILSEEDVEMGLSSETTVTLTLHSYIQHSVEEALDRLMAEHPYASASVVVIQPATGAVLAMANRPTFDPNRPGDFASAERRNRALTDPYEPGSTMKPFIASAALESGACRPGQIFDCEHGSFRIGKRIVRDHHPYGNLSFVDVMVHSSNIGIVKVGQTMKTETMHHYLQQFGFGSKTGIDLPGENDGGLAPPRKWTSFTSVSVPMGYEVSVTPLQMAAAMAAIANDGVMMKPYVVSQVADYQGRTLFVHQPTVVRRAISAETARKMKEILAQVVQRGTGTRAKIEGVDVAGKTGTSKKVDPATGTYSADKYISSFVAFAPVQNPKVCVLVVVDEPKGAYYGGQVAAPVAGEIIKDALAILQ